METGKVSVCRQKRHRGDRTGVSTFASCAARPGRRPEMAAWRGRLTAHNLLSRFNVRITIPQMNPKFSTAAILI
jgi:hypothetical protein